MTRYTPLWLQSGSYAAGVDRRLAGAIWPSARVDGMAVTPATGTTVNVAPGNAAVPTPNNTGSTLCVSDAVEQVLLPLAPAAGLNRYDLIIVRPRGTDLDGGVNNDFIFDYVVGNEAAPGGAVIPSTPAGCVSLAYVVRPGGSAAIAAADIADQRAGSLAVGLPPRPPVTSGGFQSYTDGAGDVWVAKPNVYGGAWKRARDVLYCRVVRTTAGNYPSSGGMVWDATALRDLYGMWTPGSGIKPLVPGLYQINWLLCCGFTAANQYLAVGSYGFQTRTNKYSTAAQNTYLMGTSAYVCDPSAPINIAPYTNPAALAIMGTSVHDNWLDVTYLGTG